MRSSSSEDGVLSCLCRWGRCWGVVRGESLPFAPLPLGREMEPVVLEGTGSITQERGRGGDARERGDEPSRDSAGSLACAAPVLQGRLPSPASSRGHVENLTRVDGPLQRTVSLSSTAQLGAELTSLGLSHTAQPSRARLPRRTSHEGRLRASGHAQAGRTAESTEFQAAIEGRSRRGETFSPHLGKCFTPGPFLRGVEEMGR